MSTAGDTARSGSVSPAPTPTFDAPDGAHADSNGSFVNQDHYDALHTATTSMSSNSLRSPTDSSGVGGEGGASAAGQLEPFDWKEMETRFAGKMSEYENEEAKVYEDFNDWLRLFQAWASTTTSHENERALKRLRTRMHFVQGSEARLEEKREHHQKVVEAFESALKLMEAHS